MSAVINGQARNGSGIPWPTIIAVVTMALSGLYAFSELKGDVRVLAERQESTKQDVADIKKDIRAIGMALGVNSRRDRLDGRN